MDPDTQNYRLTLAYDGRAFMGWQRHKAQRTVQGVLEDALQTAFDTRILAQGSGRTDRGTHAEGQVVSVALPTTVAQRPGSELFRSLRDALPEDIQLLGLERVAAEFHAQKSATAKTYRYRIYNEPDCPEHEKGRVWYVPETLNFNAMKAAAPVLVGEHDFASFATKTNYARSSTVRTLMSLELTADDPFIELTFRADGFLYKMVRNLVRALVKVGEGRSDRAKLIQILAARDRQAAPGTAPASGLYLESVEYDDFDTGPA